MLNGSPVNALQLPEPLTKAEVSLDEAAARSGGGALLVLFICNHWRAPPRPRPVPGAPLWPALGLVQHHCAGAAGSKLLWMDSRFCMMW